MAAVLSGVGRFCRAVWGKASGRRGGSKAQPEGGGAGTLPGWLAARGIWLTSATFTRADSQGSKSGGESQGAKLLRRGSAERNKGISAGFRPGRGAVFPLRLLLSPAPLLVTGGCRCTEAPRCSAPCSPFLQRATHCTSFSFFF